MNPEVTLRQRYPEADFAAYFCFLAEHSAKKSKETQEHHICPKKQFPEFAEGFPENLITLQIRDHAFAHRILELCEPELKAPPSALLGAQRDGAIKGGIVNRNNGTGLFSQGAQARGRKTSQEKGIGIHAPGMQAKGGHYRGKNKANGARAQMKNKTGIFSPTFDLAAAQASGIKTQIEKGIGLFGRTPEQKIADGKRGGKLAAVIVNHKRWHLARNKIVTSCSLCQSLDN